jgi:hypothetical protein
MLPPKNSSAVDEIVATLNSEGGVRQRDNENLDTINALYTNVTINYRERRADDP